MLRSVVCGIAVAVLAQALSAATVGVYFSQADWLAALGGSSVSVNFDDSDWTTTLQRSATYTAQISQSSTAARNGMAVTASSGYGAPGVVNNATLGHVSDGSWVDSISKYGNTTFTFSDSIYAFGGDFSITGDNGLYISGIGDVAYGNYTGFIGIVTDQPLSSVFISWSQDPLSLYPVFGSSYTLSDFQVATVATPEPSFGPIYLGMLILGVSYAVFRRFAKCLWCKFLRR